MYESHFGLRQRPFRPAPDGSCYYPATSHEAALARLRQGIADDEGLLILTGPPGSGKTLLCHCLLERQGPQTASAFLTNSHVGDRRGLLQAILYDLGQPYEGRGEQELRLALTDFLLKNYAEGRQTLAIVDEAQHLSAELLEELRLLSNLHARHGTAVHVLLVGQPGLLETLARPELAALRQRLATRAALEPLTVQEAADYLLHQVRAAGGRPEHVFTEESLEVLARGGQGLPRLLNQAAHQALTLAAAAGAVAVDAEAALEALAALGLEGEKPAAEDDAPPDRGPAEGPASAPLLLSAGPDDAPEERPARLYATPRRPA